MTLRERVEALERRIDASDRRDAENAERGQAAYERMAAVLASLPKRSPVRGPVFPAASRPS